jgi:hypothetical protein
MNKVIQLTKKLTLQLSARKVLANFTLINICYYRFIYHSVYLTFCNVTLRFTYEIEKQRETIKKWHEVEAEND